MGKMARTSRRWLRHFSKHLNPRSFADEPEKLLPASDIIIGMAQVLLAVMAVAWLLTRLFGR